MLDVTKFRARPSALGKIMSNAKVSGELSATCKTYLLEWYAQSFEDIPSKYMAKGILMEDAAIDYMATQLGYEQASKNINIYQNDWMIGTPDVIIGETVIDLKCSWNKKTLIESANSLNTDYEWQLRAYMWLTGCTEAILFYALMDTPADANYGKEVVYTYLPDSERWVAYQFKKDEAIEELIKERVIKCREWLTEYDKEVTAKLGRFVNKLED